MGLNCVGALILTDIGLPGLIFRHWTSGGVTNAKSSVEGVMPRVGTPITVAATRREAGPRRAVRCAVVLNICAALALAACSQSGGSQTPSAHGASATAATAAAPLGDAPIQLGRRTVPLLGGDASAPIDKLDVKRAVERFHMNAGAPLGPYRSAGLDLDGDGRGEAVVLLEGESFCVRTGCTLLILKDGGSGLWPFAQIKRVKLPVVLALTSSRGWRDLLVRTGGGGMRRMTVKLSFGPNGYPGNASILKPFLGVAEANGTVVFGKSDADAALTAAATPGDVSNGDGAVAGNASASRNNAFGVTRLQKPRVHQAE